MINATFKSPSLPHRVNRIQSLRWKTINTPRAPSSSLNVAMLFESLSILLLFILADAYYLPTANGGISSISTPSSQANGSINGTYSPASGLTPNDTEAINSVKVGVIGAGASGLYAAILLQSFGIPYEILEANDRPGGRIWTHYFDPEEWSASKPGDPNYYDYFVKTQFAHIFHED
jgi:hypothetical protein